ncbi:MAG: ferrous iron transport protein A [Liquorilactobacillus nagelii]|jgi:ferrous iron transport protein A|nr:ferrous iron transport protein A [Liquorilactobacillus nagelii]KRL39949.1 ferrous iron (Fe2+) uptake protein FeoA [Liquorilactobacillus nagelii DSM 13675]MCI1922260.1 ferrous iron transport protein A [Liquorilactobacillus nagelii]
MTGSGVMESLAEIKSKGRFIVVDIVGDPRFIRRLAELGMVLNTNLTVVSPSQNNSGLVIFLRGQRLAISHTLATNILVKGVNELATAKTQPLSRLTVGKSAIVGKIIGDRPVKRRLMDMGLTKNTVVKVHQVAPLGDPIELLVRGYKLSVRKQEADYIMVQEVSQ